MTDFAMTEPMDALFAIVGSYAILMLVLWLVLIIATWKVFTKAGEAGWKSLIPYYSNYILFKICGKKTLGIVTVVVMLLSSAFVSITNSMGSQAPLILALMSVLSIIGLVLYILLCGNLAKVFGKSTGFAIGLFLLNPIFMMILGFGSAEYVGAPDTM